MLPPAASAPATKKQRIAGQEGGDDQTGPQKTIRKRIAIQLP